MIILMFHSMTTFLIAFMLHNHKQLKSRSEFPCKKRLWFNFTKSFRATHFQLLSQANVSWRNLQGSHFTRSVAVLSGGIHIKVDNNNNNNNRLQTYPWASKSTAKTLWSEAVFELQGGNLIYFFNLIFRTECLPWKSPNQIWCSVSFTWQSIRSCCSSHKALTSDSRKPAGVNTTHTHGASYLYDLKSTNKTNRRNTICGHGHLCWGCNCVSVAVSIILEGCLIFTTHLWIASSFRNVNIHVTQLSWAPSARLSVREISNQQRLVTVDADAAEQH